MDRPITIKLTLQEEQECFKKAYDKLTMQEKYVLGRTRNWLVKSIANKRKRNAGIGRDGSLELLAKLGIWIVKNENRN
jgi:hypothetical protein